MPAPFKRTRTKEISKIAEEVITIVKKELKNKKDACGRRRLFCKKNEIT